MKAHSFESRSKGWEKRRPKTVQLYIKSKITKCNGCYIWKGATKKRVGWFEYKGISGGAPKKVYETLVGPTNGLCVLHTCDDCRCVNIKHLYLGTRKDNRRDFMERHPDAMKICLAAAKIGAKGVRKFWENMTPRQRKLFCKNRAKIQATKYPFGARNGRANARISI